MCATIFVRPVDVAHEVIMWYFSTLSHLSFACRRIQDLREKADAVAACNMADEIEIDPKAVDNLATDTYQTSSSAPGCSTAGLAAAGGGNSYGAIPNGLPAGKKKTRRNNCISLYTRMCNSLI